MTIVSQFLTTRALNTRAIAALLLAIVAASIVTLSPAHAQAKSAVALESVIEVEMKDAAGVA